MCWPLPTGWIIYWGLWVQLAGYVVWPLVALVAAFLFVGPIRRFLERTNKVSAAGVSLEALSAKVDAIEQDPDPSVTPSSPAEQRVEEPAAPEPITQSQERLEPGWRSIVAALQQAFLLIEEQRQNSLPLLARSYFRQRRYILCLNQLVLSDWISFELRDVVKSLYELRERAATGRLSDDEVAIFSRNANKSAGSILNAVRYRLRTPQTERQAISAASRDTVPSA
jgi:hypothetical protein